MASTRSGGQGIAEARRTERDRQLGTLLLFLGGAFATTLGLGAFGVSSQVFLGHGWVIVLVAIPRDVALAHPSRVRILAYLKMLPGDHFRSIVRMLGLGVGTARHHLDVLTRSGLVREDKTNGKVRYYASGAGSDSERNQLYAKHWSYRDLRLRVLFTARNLVTATPASVAAALGISRQLAAYHLASLAELGLLRREHGHYRP